MSDTPITVRVINDYWISQWIRVKPDEDYIHIEAGAVLPAYKIVIPPGNSKPGIAYEVKGVWLAPEMIEVLES